MTEGRRSDPLVVALDTADLDRLSSLAAAVGPHVGHLKVGLEAYTAHGPAAVAAAAAHAAVFLDLKLHDIPATVGAAAAAAAGLGAGLLTVHAAGGETMMRAAVDGAGPDTSVLAVTVLTSLDDAGLASVGQPAASQQVPRLAALAVSAGAGGVVCAPGEIAAVRAAVGDGPLVVTPGVRPAGADPHDHARAMAPRVALDAGADALVVGRPITDASDPAAAAREMRAEMGAAGRPR